MSLEFELAVLTGAAPVTSVRQTEMIADSPKHLEMAPAAGVEPAGFRIWSSDHAHALADIMLAGEDRYELPTGFMKSRFYLKLLPYKWLSVRLRDYPYTISSNVILQDTHINAPKL